MSTIRTPGPWAVLDDGHGDTQIAGPDGYHIATVWPGAGNASLIAAAPDLFEACEAVAEDVCSSLCPSKWRTDSGQPHSAQCGQLRAAIKKARTPST